MPQINGRMVLVLVCLLVSGFAILTYMRGGTSATEFTERDLHHMAERSAHRLAAQLQRGDKVALILPPASMDPQGKRQTFIRELKKRGIKVTREVELPRDVVVRGSSSCSFGGEILLERSAELAGAGAVVSLAGVPRFSGEEDLSELTRRLPPILIGLNADQKAGAQLADLLDAGVVKFAVFPRFESVPQGKYDVFEQVYQSVGPEDSAKLRELMEAD